MSEISVRLPDGNTLAVPQGSTILDVANAIGPGLGKAALAGRIEGQLVDLRLPLNDDVAIEIVTARDKDGGDVIRHSAEHVMADAVKRLFPKCQIDAGRADHSEKFQYDFLVDEPFTPDDLERIEKEMQRIIKQGTPFAREAVSRDDARKRFADMGEELKLSRIDDIPEDSEITVFQHGEFQDLCRGPHVQNTSQIGAIKLLEASGTYFRGDESSHKLQRIYGTAFASKKELKSHLARIEEAKKRDHRRVGVALDLYLMDAVSPGSPFYLPKGMAVYNGLVDFIRELYPRHGYEEVMTPQLCRAELFKTSGHYEMFKEDMYFFEGEDEHEEIGLKATNCPGHCQVFDNRLRSYRELPLRMAEFSRLHRNERSGTLNGLARVRSFAQDDAHIFCEPEQVDAEVQAFFDLMAEIYGALGLGGVHMAVSTRPEKYLGSDEDWDHAEKMLVECVERAGFECAIKEGEAVFYGPKVEADFEDVLGRRWTLGTIQIDMAMPGRFGLEYVGRDGEKHQPAMLHRAVLGSIERFMAIYIEHTGGDFPFWLSPVQVAILPISAAQHERAREIEATLMAAGIRAEVDERSETLGFKIRETEINKIPLSLVIGEKEVESGTVTPRLRKSRKQQFEAMALDALVGQLVENTKARNMGPLSQEG
ncbi:MAG: threonine--tRNA ligase [Myxococcota bacterium]|jgi:threonyl-tRNA synthetase|nr:threonine--tRNA ligase [Myxococcota bacterium]